MVIRRVRRGRAKPRYDELEDDEWLTTSPVTIADEEVNNDDMVVSNIRTSSDDPIVIIPMSERIVPDERAVQFKLAKDKVNQATVACGSSDVSLDRLDRYLKYACSAAAKLAKRLVFSKNGLSLEKYREQFGYSSVPQMLRMMQNAVSVAEMPTGEFVVSAGGNLADVDLISWDDDAAEPCLDQNRPSTSGTPTYNSSHRSPLRPAFEYGEDADPKGTLLHLAAAVFHGCKQSADKQLTVSVYDEDLSAILPPPEAHVCSAKELLEILTKFFRNTFKIERAEEGPFVIKLLPDLLNDTEPTHPPTELTAAIDVETPDSELPSIAIDFTKDYEVELGHIFDDTAICKDRCTFALHLRANRQKADDLERGLKQYTEAERRDPDPPVTKLIDGQHYLLRDPKATLARCQVTRIIDHAHTHNQVFAHVKYIDQGTITTANSSVLIELPQVFAKCPPLAIVGFIKIRPDLKAHLRSELVGARERKDVSVKARFKRPEDPDANEYEVELTCLQEGESEYVLPRDYLVNAMPPPEELELVQPEPPPTYRIPSLGGVIRMPSAPGNQSNERAAAAQPMLTISTHDRSGSQRPIVSSSARLQPQPRPMRPVPVQQVRPAFQPQSSTNRPIPPIQTASRPQPSSSQPPPSRFGRPPTSGVSSASQRPLMRGNVRPAVALPDRAGTYGSSRQLPANHGAAARPPPVTHTHAAASTTTNTARSAHAHPSSSRQSESGTLPDIARPVDESFIKDQRLGNGPVKKICMLCGVICLGMAQAREHLRSKSHLDKYLKDFRAEISAKLIGQEHVHDSSTVLQRFSYACMLCSAKLRDAADVKEHLASELHTREYSSRDCDPRNWDAKQFRNWMREIGTSLLNNLRHTELTGAAFVARIADDFERDLGMCTVDAIRAYTLVRKMQSYYS
ncbi:hypothetical protein AAVH_07819 [Aphelenchoides avenae]|nr:hypothetical protein AAVH_07819 [Aphelenchus avenae]